MQVSSAAAHHTIAADEDNVELFMLSSEELDAQVADIDAQIAALRRRRETCLEILVSVLMGRCPKVCHLAKDFGVCAAPFTCAFTACTVRRQGQRTSGDQAPRDTGCPLGTDGTPTKVEGQPSRCFWFGASPSVRWCACACSRGRAHALCAVCSATLSTALCSARIALSSCPLGLESRCAINFLPPTKTWDSPWLWLLSCH